MVKISGCWFCRYFPAKATLGVGFVGPAKAKLQVVALIGVISILRTKGGGFCLVALLAERLAEGRGSATIATAENNQVPTISPMRQKPRYLQRLVRPGSVGSVVLVPWEHGRT